MDMIYKDDTVYRDACYKLVELAADGIDVRPYANELRAAYAEYADTSNDARYKRAIAKINETYRYA